MRYLQAANQTNKIKLDLKDKKILSILAEDSRIPLTKLCKKVGLSRDAVNYRIKDYEKKGLIQGYKTLVDISKFGYDAPHLFIKLSNPAQEQEKKIIKRISDLPFVRAVLKFSGNFDFEIAFVAKDIQELDKNLNLILNSCGEFVQDYELLTISKGIVSEAFPKSLIDSREASIKEMKTIPVYKNEDKKDSVELDKKDIEILKIISENAAESLVEIANKVKLSADAVSYRIKNMKDKRFIIKFMPAINYSAADYGMYAILINVNGMDDKKEKLIREFLQMDKNTLWAVKTIGRYNILAYLLVKNVEELQETTIKLKALFPNQIKRFITLIAYEEYKYLYFPSKLF